MNVVYVNVQDSTLIDDFVSIKLSSREVVEFLQDTYDHTKLVEFLNKNIDENADVRVSKPLSVHVLKSRTIVNYQFFLKKLRFSFSVNYVTVDKNRMCENGASYSIVKEAYDKL